MVPVIVTVYDFGIWAKKPFVEPQPLSPMAADALATSNNSTVVMRPKRLPALRNLAASGRKSSASENGAILPAMLPPAE